MSVIHDLADMLANQDAGSGRSPGKRLPVLSPTLRLFRSMSLRARIAMVFARRAGIWAGLWKRSWSGAVC